MHVWQIWKKRWNLFQRLIGAKRRLILTLLLCTCALQGWHTVDTCPQCGLTCQLWSTTTSSPQTDPARHPGASAKRCGASTRKTARWVQPLILQTLQHNETARPSSVWHPPPHTHNGKFKTQTPQQIAKSSSCQGYWSALTDTVSYGCFVLCRHSVSCIYSNSEVIWSTLWETLLQRIMRSKAKDDRTYLLCCIRNNWVTAWEELHSCLTSSLFIRDKYRKKSSSCAYSSWHQPLDWFKKCPPWRRRS